MNISQMMRGLLGEGASGGTRVMELKPGQVVRGVVMQLMDNNEAIVQINGVQVRAKLEMPLQAGQSAILQVQPESNGSVIVLKGVDLSATGLLDDTFRDIAKQLGLPDQRWALDIVKDLRREGFPFDRATARAFQQAAAAMPQGASPEQWMQAAAAAFKRGLPMTAETIVSMQQVMFGKGAHELLETLQRQLASLVGSQAGSVANEAAGSQQAASRVLLLLQQGAALLQQGTAMGGREAGAPAGMPQGNLPGAATAQGIAAAPGHAVNVPQPQTLLQQAVAGDASAAGAQASAGNAARAEAAPGNWLSGLMKWLGVDHELQLAKAATARDGGATASGADSSRAAASESGAAARATAAPNAAPTAPQQPGTALAAGGAATSQAAAGEPLPPQQQPQAVDARAAAQRLAASGAASLLAASSDAAEGAPPAQTVQAQHETLKGALLSLVGGGDIPPAARETAQQLIHQITGQQLLLSPERNSSLFTHVTFFIPLRDEDGGSTASVHIQTRRGRKGELDADNCRLLFNLSMQTIGDTLVDVNIADKIVSLNLWNDHPAIAGLVEGSRADMAERLQASGYQLLSLKTTPLPKRDDEEEARAGQADKRSMPPDSSQFASTRYKGVDYRA